MSRAPKRDAAKAPKYGDQVFINCPFDEAFKPLLDAIVFAVLDCGFRARSALEIGDSSEVRIEKIFRIISECQYAVHDLSRTELDATTELPRFNMPLELGIFLGAKRYGAGYQKNKNCLILDREPYRYQKFISDIAGQDIRSHSKSPEATVAHVRDWLADTSRRKTIPGGAAIWKRYRLFEEQLPLMAEKAELQESELTFNDRVAFIFDWLVETGRLSAAI